MKSLQKIIGAAALCAVAGCNIDLGNLLGFGEPEPQIARLKPFASEDELKTFLVGQNNQPSRPGIDVFFEAEDTDAGGGLGGALSADGAAPPAAPSPNGADQGSGESGETGERNFSTTTEQEEGVQEADVIKNDGSHLYILSRDALRIVQAVPADALAESGAVELDGYGIDMYLVGDRVVTLTTPNEPVYLGRPVDDPAVSFIAPDFAYYRPQTEITVIDASDRANPQVVSTTRIDGSVNASRMIGDRLYVVMVNYPDVFVQPLLAAETQKRSFEDVDLNEILPDIAVRVGGTEVLRKNIAEFDDHFRPEAEDGLGLTSIVTFDVDAPQDYDAQTIVAYPANIYASASALYLTDTDYDFGGSLRETTDIYKFDFTESGIAQSAAGTVPGRVLNQYSMSEHAGFLRVATSKGAVFGPLGQTAPSTNNVYVLEQANDELQLAGRIEDLAPGETIFSARFIGDKGYLVTFEQIDPLFTLDMSNPRDPRMIGELKVPGFSTFITPMGENHLLTVGRHTDEQFGFANGVRLSIFDVSDFANPTLAHFEVIGEDGSAFSEAVYNPKAFSYFASGDLVALPVEVYGNRGGFIGPEPGFLLDVAEAEDGGSGSDASPPPPTDGGATDGGAADDEPVDVFVDLPAPEPVDQFRGLYVYRATPENGFEKLGEINSLVRDGDNPYYYGPQFIRGAFIDDKVYCATSDNVQAADVSDVSNVIATVLFPMPEFDDTPVPLPVDDGFVGGGEVADSNPVEEPADAPVAE
jgi:hypothetical protein